MEIEKMLEEEIRTEFDALRAVELGSQTYETMVDGLTKLTDRAIELKKIEAEREDKKNEEFRANVQMGEERRDRWARNGIAIAGIILPLAVTIWGTRTSLKFEEEGTITTVAGRGFINKLIPKK